MRNRTNIIGFAAFVVICGTALVPVFAQDAPPENVAARAPLITGSQASIKIVDAELKKLKDELASRQKVRDSLQKNMDADVASIEREGWTWDWNNSKPIPFEGSPKG